MSATSPVPMVAAGGDRGVLDAARALHAAGEAFVLSLVVHSEGSTYRKPGAIAVVGADGRRHGAISGGCLEPALVELARQALRDGRAHGAVFDTRGEDDLVFGSGSGCRGLMRVVAFPVPSAAGSALFDALVAAHARDVPLQVALLLDDAARPGRGLVRHGDVEVVLGAPEAIDRESLRAALDATKASDAIAAFGLAVFQIRPPPHVLLLGAGPEILPLLRFAQALGWRCSVADHRTGLLEAAGDAGAQVLALRPAPALSHLAGTRIDAVLAMSHLAGADLAALQALALRDIAYVGLLGPPSRRDELLALLDPMQRDALLPRLHAPVGLPLGGEGPEAIALAIVAELQRHFHAR
jgi:xanthine dehydrogenase accessory factor